MLDKLKRICDRYDQLTEQMAEPDAINDRDAWREMVKEHSSLEEIVSAYHAYEETLSSLKDCRDMLSDHLDPEMKELVREEIGELEARSTEQEEELKVLLAPKDPNDDKNIILEIRAGTGGDEAALFGADLLRMYLRYAERHGYQVETIDSSVTEMGGVKEIVLSFAGRHGVYPLSRATFPSHGGAIVLDLHVYRRRLQAKLDKIF